MSEEIKALREEIAKLRERIAVLEAGARWEYQPQPFVPAQPYQPVWMAPPAQPWTWPNTVTCVSGTVAADQRYPLQN